MERWKFLRLRPATSEPICELEAKALAGRTLSDRIGDTIATQAGESPVMTIFSSLLRNALVRSRKLKNSQMRRIWRPVR